MAESNCRTCRFFTSQQTMGLCKRYPMHNNKHENDWCGEHLAKLIEVIPLQVYDITTDQTTEVKKRKYVRKQNAETAA